MSRTLPVLGNSYGIALATVGWYQSVGSSGVSVGSSGASAGALAGALETGAAGRVLAGRISRRLAAGGVSSRKPSVSSSASAAGSAAAETVGAALAGASGWALARGVPAVWLARGAGGDALARGAPGEAAVMPRGVSTAAGLVAMVSGAGLAPLVSAAAPGDVALPSPLAADLARAREVAVFDRALAVVLPGRAPGDGFARALAVVPDREAAAGFARAPGAGPVGRFPAAGNPEAAVAVSGPAVTGRAGGPMASVLPWSRSAEAALAARGRLAARAWLSVPAGCFSAPRLGAGPVPRPVEPSPGVPFSEVTAP
jgi:hypothetical protein